MSEIEDQLLSVRLNSVYDKSGGHNDETAFNEIGGDNPTDEGAKNIILIDSPCFTDGDRCVSAFAILDDGPGLKNINHLWGTGKGLTIKSSDKIGSKISGALAAVGYFNPDKLMYFSRKLDNVDGRQHQQLNADFSEIMKVIQTPGMDMTDADNRIKKGANKLVRLPELSKDKFDPDDILLIKQIFRNHPKICEYFDGNQTGLLEVFIFYEVKETTYIASASEKITEYVPETAAADQEGINKIINERYLRFKSELPKILDKNEFITYNTKLVFRGDTSFEYINVDDECKNRVINCETSKSHFILGKKSIQDDPVDELEEDEDEEEKEEKEEKEDEEEKADEEEEDEEDEDEEDDWNFVEAPHFGRFNKNVLTVKNSIYETNKGYINLCQLVNFNETFMITEDIIDKIKYIKKEDTGSIKAPAGYKKIKHLGVTYDHIAIVDKEEAKEQAQKMGLSKLEDMKCVYVYNNGRYLDKDAIPVLGIQPRSLPNFRIATCVDSKTEKLIPKRSKKSSISLKDSAVIIRNTYSEIIKPILNINSSQSASVDFEKAIQDWSVYKVKILIALGVIKKPEIVATVITKPAAATASSTTTSTTSTTTSTTSSSTATTPVPPPHARSSTMVLGSLNKSQTIAQLKRIKTKHETISGTKNRGDKCTLFSAISKMMKDLTFDHNLWSNYIDNVIEMIEDSDLDNTEKVKNAAELQNF